MGGPSSGRRSLLAQGPSAAAGVLSESPHPATPAGPRLPSVLVRVGTESGLAPTGREAACMAANRTWVCPGFLCSGCGPCQLVSCSGPPTLRWGDTCLRAQVKAASPRGETGQRTPRGALTGHFSGAQAGCRPEVVSCSHKPPFIPNSQILESTRWLCGTGYQLHTSAGVFRGLVCLG